MDRNEKLDLLERVHARLSRGWCQGDYAADARGEERDYDSDQAVSWCIQGACYVESALVLRLPEYLAALESRGYANTVKFNDAPGRTQQEVLDLISEAKARVK